MKIFNYKMVLLFLIFISTNTMAGITCMENAYIVGIDMNAENASWNEWGIRVNQTPRSDANDQYFPIDSQYLSTSSDSGRAMYVTAMAAMNHGWKVDLYNLYGSSCSTVTELSIKLADLNGDQS